MRIDTRVSVHSMYVSNIRTLNSMKTERQNISRTESVGRGLLSKNAKRL